MAYALDQKRTVFWIRADDPQSPVARLVEIAADGSSPPHADPLPETAESLSSGFAELARYNRQGLLETRELAAELRQNAAALTRSAREVGFDPDLLAPAMDQLLPRCVRADRLAVRFQRRYQMAGRALFCLSAVAVTLAIGQQAFLPDQAWVSLLEFASMGAAWLLYAVSRRRRYHEKWLQNRFIAERFRNALFRMVGGEFPGSQSSCAEAILPFYPGPQNWLVASVNRIIADARRTAPAAPPFEAWKRFVVRNWIAEQRDWHALNARRKARARAACTSPERACSF